MTQISLSPAVHLKDGLFTYFVEIMEDCHDGFLTHIKNSDYSLPNFLSLVDYVSSFQPLDGWMHIFRDQLPFLVFPGAFNKLQVALDDPWHTEGMLI